MTIKYRSLSCNDTAPTLLPVHLFLVQPLLRSLCRKSVSVMPESSLQSRMVSGCSVCNTIRLNIAPLASSFLVSFDCIFYV